MNLVELLRADLKSPTIIDLLELHEVDVVYDFDRLFEGQQDAYWASIHEEGLLFKFSEAQTLQTVFVYIRPTERFSPCDPSKYGVGSFDSVDEAESFAKDRGLQTTSRDLRPDGPNWILIDFGSYSAHYQYSDSGLTLITLMVAEVVPG